MGGRSGEHEVSLVSGRAVAAALDRRKYSVSEMVITREGRWTLGGKPLRSVWMTLDRLDVVLPILHGPYGEDGTIQGMLEMVGVAYAGAGVLGSAAGMDKDVMKRLFRAAGLPVVASVVVARRHWQASPGVVVAEVEKALRYPVFVKPANLGSSVGISKVHRRRELAAAMGLAGRYDAKIMVEQGVAARELECAVLGNEDPQASVVGEVIAANEFYDYEAKYADVGSRTMVPAKIEARVARRVRELAIRAFQATEGAGLARVDFFLEKGSGKLYVNEINTMPGFTPISMYPKLWAAAGMDFPALLDRLIALGRERWEQKRGGMVL